MEDAAVAVVLHLDGRVESDVDLKGDLTALRVSGAHGQPLERLEKDTDRDNFMGAEEAQEYGIVDAVLRQRPV